MRLAAGPIPGSSPDTNSRHGVGHKLDEMVQEIEQSAVAAGRYACIDGNMVMEHVEDMLDR